MNRALKKILSAAFITLFVVSGITAQSMKKPPFEETKKNYTGWVDTSYKDVISTVGQIRLTAKTKLGSFNISVINEDGKKYPVLYNGNEYTSTGFYLKVNNKIYRLLADSNIKTNAKKTASGMQVTYSIKDVADVFVDFKCVESVAGNGYDMVRIASTVTNKGPKKADFALKLVLDTVLGETAPAHFYTSSDVPVRAETMYRTMQNEKWFMSKNNHAQMQILLKGGDITSPEIVALANYTTLEKNTWEPEMLSYRTFDTVLSYNNSAVGVIWPSKKVSVDSKNTNVFYLAFSSDDTKPKGEEYLAEKERQKQIDVTEAVAGLTTPKEPEKADPVPEPVKKEPEVHVQPAPVEVAVEKTEPVPVKVESQKPVRIEPLPIPPVKRDLNKLSVEQLTPEYIQNLIDRISAMEEDPDMVNEEEIKLLNAELDAILQALM